MEYTVQKLAALAGVSTRTLRYYDQIDLLKPARINSSGYRIYGAREVDALQQILFYRELGVELDDIRALLTSPGYDRLETLRAHREALLEKRKRLTRLIENVEMTIEESEGGKIMSDKEKFEGFKRKLVEDNEAKYGEEIREKYGKETVEASNKKMLNMSEEEYKRMEALSEKLNETLKAAVATGDPAGELAQEACDLHKQWLMFHWEAYNKEAHMGLGEMYVADPRFAEYYDKIAPGAAVFLRDALRAYTA